MTEVNGNTIEFQNRMTGTVVHWVKDYGFIRPDDDDLPNVFVHYNDILVKHRKDFKVLLKGDKVKFVLKPVMRNGEEGYHAIKCQVVTNQRRVYGKDRTQPSRREENLSPQAHY
jgi:cold shock CspA family protein